MVAPTTGTVAATPDMATLAPVVKLVATAVVTAIGLALVTLLSATVAGIPNMVTLAPVAKLVGVGVVISIGDALLTLLIPCVFPGNHISTGSTPLTACNTVFAPAGVKLTYCQRAEPRPVTTGVATPKLETS